MDPLNELLIALAIAGWIVGFGLASARIATQLERRPSVWFTIGAVAGPIALLVLRTAPPGRCRACGAATRGWHRICWWCHEDVRSTPAATQAIVDRMSARAAEPEATAPPAPVAPAPARPFVIQADPAGPRPQRPPAVQPLFRLAGSTPAEAPGAERPKRHAVQAAPSSAASTAVGGGVERNGSPPSPEPRVVIATRRPADPPVMPVDAPREPRTVPSRPPTGDALHVLATAIFVAGSGRLEPGHRYGLALRSARFQVIGPIDVDPKAVVLDRAVAQIEVQTVEGRLIVSEPDAGSGLVLAFMSVAGPPPNELAAAINGAARDARGA